MTPNMVRRVAFAAVAIPAVVAIVWLGAWPLAALLAVAGVLGVRELADLAERTGTRLLRGIAVTTAVAIPALLGGALASAAVNAAIESWWAVGAVLWILVVMTAALAFRTPEERPLEVMAITVFAVAYAVLLPAVLYVIRHAAEPPRSWAGTALVFLPLVVVWISDTAAMLAGTAIGGANLAPIVSPHKTRAGAAAGVIFGAMAGAAYAAAVFRPLQIGVSVGAATVLAVGISVAGQVGDLAESLLKREAGVKDSSTLIPGHGGVLDRLDALYFAIPIAAAGYHLLRLM